MALAFTLVGNFLMCLLNNCSVGERGLTDKLQLLIFALKELFLYEKDFPLSRTVFFNIKQYERIAM